MKTLTKYIVLLLITSVSIAQNKTQENIEKILGDWVFEQFEQARQSGDMLIVTKTGYVDEVHFIFNSDYTLDVIYSDSKKEKYNWKINRYQIKIFPANELIQNEKISDNFEINFLAVCNQVFLERNQPHDGIMLKKVTPAAKTR
jgi:septum formation inhibitor-activating ATPase MinD